jgi:hypothetical protein
MTLFPTWLKLSLPVFMLGGLPLHASCMTESMTGGMTVSPHSSVSADSLLPVTIRHVHRESTFPYLVVLRLLQANAPGSPEVKSDPVAGPDIWDPFEDGKTASSYALLLQVKQPLPGKRKSYTGINNVGHTFITLIKYNTDNTYVSRSFGFYPNKRGILSATPLHPRAPSVFKNDSLHEWDEAVGKFISCRKFQRIIRIIKRYNLREYDLNQNNCTNFGLNVAMIAGISIRETSGRWPLGEGSNPANAGQSILEGKIGNTDGDSAEPLFISRSSALAGYYP